MSNTTWHVYSGGSNLSAEPQVEQWLASPPPWRRPHDVGASTHKARKMSPAEERRGRTYVATDDQSIHRINCALLLRRPILVTGDPGLGKTTLAYNIAWCLDLGAPLRWEINSRSTLKDGLYEYDAVGHLQATREGGDRGIADFITLGPLGTALLPTERPRVLLIDEIDKANFDLPNDLLHVFEEGAFEIRELLREGGKHEVLPFDGTDRVAVDGGRIRTLHHPVTVMTSNGEREFPEAFKRRCVTVHLERPDETRMRAIIRSQLGEDPSEELVASSLQRFGNQATDVLIQALFLESKFGADEDQVARSLKRS